MNNNFLILTPGHTGSSIFSRMMGALGWNIGNIDWHAEDIDVRSVNAHLLETGNFDQEKAAKIINSLQNPFCIKDPRFSEPNLIQNWIPILEQYKPGLIYLKRKTEYIIPSYDRRGGPVEMAHRRIAECGKIINNWPWGVVIIDFDDLTKAVELFDKNKIISKPN